MARGYLNREDLTKEKFVLNPFATCKENQILYKTGDLVRYLHDGNIEFLGRIDQQVKIRGFRIELGEIEQQLLKIETIQDALVLDLQDLNQNKYLCAYLVCNQEIKEEEIKKQLAKELPEYMIPSAFVFIEKIPLTANGKIDKRALPKPLLVEQKESSLYVKPRNEQEMLLAEIWQEVLGIEKVSIYDNFFSLGGDSIKAIQVAARLKKHNLKLDNKKLFATPTIAELWSELEKTGKTADNSLVVGAVPLMPIQKWFFAQKFVHPEHWNQSALFISKGKISLEILNKALHALVMHHDALRMSYQFQDGEIKQYNRALDDGVFFQAELLKLVNQEEKAVKLEIEEKFACFQKAMNFNGPLLQACIFATQNQDYDYLALAIHHLVVDGISWNILAEDLEKAYWSYQNGEKVHFQDKSDSFKSWSEKISLLAESNAILKDLQYWQQIDAKEIKPLPFDKEPKSFKNKDLKEEKLCFERELTERFFKEGEKAYGTTAEELILTALSLAVCYWTDGENQEIAVTLEGHGREEILHNMDITRTVGWFTATYPVLLKALTNDLGKMLKVNKEHLRHIPNRGVTYDLIQFLVPENKKNAWQKNLKSEIEFNYFGEISDSEISSEKKEKIFKLIEMNVGEDASLEEKLDFKLYLSAYLEKGALTLKVLYNHLQYQNVTMEKFLQYYQKAVEDLGTFCSGRERELTVSEVADQALSLEEFETLKEHFSNNIERIYPLSGMQEGMLFLSLASFGKSMAYTEQAIYLLKGKMDEALFLENLQSVIDKYAVLRTAFFTQGLEKPRQVVLKKVERQLKFVSLNDCTEDEQKIKLELLAKEERESGFDLSEPPLLRIIVAKVNENEHFIILSFLHIILDGWSMALLEQALLNDYCQKATGVLLPAAKEVPYENYINWLEGQDQTEAKEFWKNYLLDLEEQTVVPNKKNKEKLLDDNDKTVAVFKDVEFSLNKDLTKKLKLLGRECNVTLGVILQALFGVLLARYNNSKDAVYGVIVSGRNISLKDAEAIVGLFVNNLPVRVSLDRESSFIDLLKKMQAEALQLDQYSYLSLAEIQAQSSLRSNLINTFLVLQNNSEKEALDVEGFELQEIAGFDQVNYDFSVVVVPQESIDIRFNYNELVYEECFVERMAEHFVKLVEEALKAPQISPCFYEFISKKEKENIFTVSKGESLSYNQNLTVIDCFQEYAKENPQKIALCDLEKNYTYAEVAVLTAKLAAYLKEKGLQQEETVAVLVNRNAKIMLAALAIMQAGGVYLPIDSNYPKERIEYMLSDSKARFLLVDEENQEKVTGKDLARILLEHTDTWQEIFKSQILEKSFAKPKDLAYIIYTSGSTGKPKGVMIEHANLMNLCQWMYKYHNIDESTVAAAYSGFGFDASIWETIPFLACGATLHIIAEKLRLSPEALNEYFTMHKVTITNLPTQFCEYFMEEIENKTLKTLVTGGDKLKSFKKRNYRLVNEYGPTEYTVSATAFLVQNMLANIPIGKPLANSWCYVLDIWGNLQALGLAGELCLAGLQMARGYLNQEELTKEKFKSNPFADSKENQIIYHTGDLVSFLPDGNLEFLGRIDKQVKIRGFRIELGEIEQKMLQHEAIKEAVVLDKTDKTGEKYLCAYFTTEKKVLSKELTTFLSSELPEYMIPSYFMELEKIPVNANGKVDNRALLEFETEDTASFDYVAPRTEVEEKLALIWQEVLSVARVGVYDNFLKLGGHSLKMTILATKLQKIFDLKISPAEIFKMPVLKDMANYVVNANLKADFKEIAVAEEKEYYPLSSAQRRIFIVQQMEGIDTAYNITTVQIIEGNLDKEKLSLAFDALVMRHEALRTSFFVIDGEPMQKIYSKVKYKKRLRMAEESAIESIVEDFSRAFDLKEAPLFRLELVELTKEKHLLLFEVHHIVFDGISMGVLMEDLMKLYAGMEPEKLKIQYHDFAVWQSEFLKSEAIKLQENYWLNAFSGEIPLLNLPYDFPRPVVKSYLGDVIEGFVNDELTEKLKKMAQETGTTLYMLMLAVFKVLLAKYSNQEDIVVGSPASGRPHADLDHLIGMFVSTLPLRTYPDSEKTFTDFLQEVRQTTLDAVSNQDYPFEWLVEKLGVKRDFSRNPLFDVMFSLENQTDSFELAELKFSDFVQGSSKMAQFDLTMDISEEKTGLSIALEYCIKLFKKETVERMLGHYLNLLEQVVDLPSQKIAAFKLITPKEEEHILKVFNDTYLPVPKGATIHGMFKAVSQAYPDSFALVYNGRMFTYQELDKMTDSLAKKLRQKGVGRDVIVPIMVKRSADIILGTLAIMKAGGAYLPIDPDYPQDRIQYMLEDSKAKILLSQNILKEKVVDFQGEIIDLGKKELYEEDVVLENINQDSDLCYIIYTSGSTGKPKGVMIEHRNLVNLCVWHHNYHKITRFDSSAAYSGFGFDASVWEMYPFLTIGATLHIIPEDLRLVPEKLNEYFEFYNITVTNFPTQFCEQFMEIEENNSLKTVVTGGDKLKSFKARDYCLVNEYGPTEYTISATAFLVDKMYDNIPIGKPLGNTWAYVLDKACNLQPIGVPGELCLAGAQIARGYWQREDLTKEKFVNNPFKTGENNALMYRTGDLVRYLPDGNLEFLGRIDQQVKIRGFRIELGEIEQQILRISKVKDTVVVDLADRQGNKFLVAYIVADEDLHKEELKLLLAKELPEYMLPSYFIFVESIPLTANGKIDKRALPIPDLEAERKSKFVAPRNEKECKILNVWSEVLGVSQLGIEDNFFEIGGHSLKAVAVAAKLQKYFEVSVNDLFEYQTIKSLAAKIKEKQNNLRARLEDIKESVLLALKEENEDAKRELAITSYKQEYRLKNKKYEQRDLTVVKKYQNILLTGATGYLGIHILAELLQKRESRIYLVVRAKDKEQATKRVLQKMQYYFGCENELEAKFKNRVIVFVGELSQEQLGLSDADYDLLAKEVDCIIHTAANVRHYGHYQEFYESNVKATINLVTLAETLKVKDIEYISTVSVASGYIKEQELVVFSENDADLGQELDNYYLKTKLEGEKVIIDARQRKIKGNIYRVGNISFNARTGVLQENIEENAFFTQLKAYINVGMVPKVLDEAEFSFVDCLAEAIVLLHDKENIKNETFHLYNPVDVKLSEILTNQDLNVNVEATDFSCFIDVLYQKYDQKGFKEFIEAIMLHSGWLDEGDEQGTEFIVLQDKTNLILEKLGFEWSSLKAEMLLPMIKRALKERIGFISEKFVLKGLKEEDAVLIASLAKQELILCDKDLLWEGEIKRKFYIVLDGFVEISCSAFGGWLGTMGVVGQGDFIGEENIFSQNPSSITAEAIMDDTLLLAIDADKFAEVLAENKDIAMSLIKVMSDKLRKMSKLFVSMG